jgi:hypothetical protein
VGPRSAVATTCVFTPEQLFRSFRPCPRSAYSS